MFKDLLIDLHQAGAVVLRNAHTLPDATDNDIDLVAERRSLPKIESVIRDWALKQGWECVEKVEKYGYIGYWIYHTESNRWMPIDVFTDLSWRGFRFADVATVLQTAKLNAKGVMTISPGAEAAITLCKELVQGSVIPERKWNRLRQLAPENRHDFEMTLSPYLSHDLIDVLYKCCVSGEGVIVVLVRQIRGELARRWLRNGFNFLCFTKAALLNGLFGRLNFFVALAGPDGSGKTSVVDHLERYFEGKPFKKIKRRKLTFGILPEIKVLLGFLRRKPVNTSVEDEPGSYLIGMVKPLSALRALIYELYYGLDLFLGWRQLILWRGQWSFVIFDRYFTDYFYFRTHRKVPIFFKKLFYLFLPKPDALLYLNCDADAIFERKPELTVEEIRTQQQIIESSFSKKKYYCEVDGDKCLESVLDEAERLISLKFLERCRGF